MRVFDCFTFFNELDLLAIRLEELRDVVDEFVLVEATRTHRGRPKPLYFQEHKGRFRAHADRLSAFVVHDLPADPAADPWDREREQRRRIGDYLAVLGAEPDDLVLVSDADEIPRASALPAALAMVDRRRFAILVQTLYRFALNNVTRNDEHLCGWCGTVAFRYRELEHTTTQAARLRWSSAGQFYRHASPDRRRRCVPDAGWHFTSMGGPAARTYKVQSFAHEEEDDPHVPRITPASSLLESPPRGGACRTYGGSCPCGCTWRGQLQTYSPLRFGADFELADDLPLYVKQNKHRFPGLFRSTDR